MRLRYTTPYVPAVHMELMNMGARMSIEPAFKARCSTRKEGDLTSIDWDIVPNYPRVYYFGMVGVVLTLFFTGLRWSLWLVPSLLVTGSVILYTKFFYLGMIKSAIRRKFGTEIILKKSSLI